MIGLTADVKGDVSEGASAGATTVVVASTTADGNNAVAFACHAGGKMIGLTADVEGDVSEGASAGATTVGNVSFGVANDAAFASRAAVVDVEADYRKAISDDERLPFWPVPVPEVRGLFELQHK